MINKKIMDISKIEKMKDDLFDALENDFIESLEFHSRHHKWLIEDEQADIEEEYIDKIITYILKTPRNGNFNFDENIRNYLICNDIAYHTSNLSFVKKVLFNQLMRKTRIIKRVKPFKNKKGYEFLDYNGNKLEFSLLSKKCPNIYEAYPYLTDFDKRGNKCHPHAICLSQLLSNDEVFVVTGNTETLKAPNGFLHSWIELVADNGKTIVIDFNYNACFNKDDYYKIKKPVVLSRIPKKDIKKFFFDYDVCSKEKYSHIPMKECLLFFYEILDYYKKNMKEYEKLSQDESQPN